MRSSANETINSFFWDGAVSECLTKGYNAIAYELVIPETDEPLLLCIWADGHVDSGCERHVIDCMAQFWIGKPSSFQPL